jgi:hypothetical protein
MLAQGGSMFRTITTIAALTLVALAGPALAQERIQSGSLTCDVSAGIGLIIGSQRNVSCTFTPSLPGPVEYYTGRFSKLGVDIGVTAGGVMICLVYAPTNRPVGGLTGTYVGATADASVVAGLGANALIGGSNRTIALQPVSVSGQVGLNVAAGIGDLELRYVR